MLRFERAGGCLWALVAVSALGCGSERDTPIDQRDPAKQCTPGQEAACACGAEATGVHVCGPAGYFDACQCGGGAGSGGGGGGGASGGKVLDSGTMKLIDVFVAPAGAIIVTIDAVRIVDRMGTVVQEATWAREIEAAAFDGAHVVIADAAKLVTLDTALVTVAEGDLTEPCARVVLVSANRVVCGPDSDTFRKFYTYDALTATQLAVSEEYTYHGVPMRRVPGKEELVTVSVGTSPSDYFLHRVGADGLVTYINDSPYHGGDFVASEVFGFIEDPATHLVNYAGSLFRIDDGVNCVPQPPDNADSGCFVKDGNIGTLAAEERLLGMDSDASGTLYALVTPTWDTGKESRCAEGCQAQRIDPTAHTLVSERSYTTDLGEVVAARHDSTANALLVGYRHAGYYDYEEDPYPGYAVSLLPYE